MNVKYAVALVAIGLSGIATAQPPVATDLVPSALPATAQSAVPSAMPSGAQQRIRWGRTPGTLHDAPVARIWWG